MKLLILFFALTLSGNTHADTYHRFWRGYKLSTLSDDQFKNSLNQVFITRTIQNGNHQGLIAYEPWLNLGLIPDFPDEIALVSYQDETTYNTLFATDAGKAYVALHWQYFDHATSASTVPEAYIGTIEMEHAYDLHPQFAGWESGHSRVLVTTRKTAENDAAYLQRAKTAIEQSVAQDTKMGIAGHAFLVSENYWIEYVSFVSSIAEPKLHADFNIPLKNAATEKAVLSPGHGVNVQF